MIMICNYKSHLHTRTLILSYKLNLNIMLPRFSCNLHPCKWFTICLETMHPIPVRPYTSQPLLYPYSHISSLSQLLKRIRQPHLQLPNQRQFPRITIIPPLHQSLKRGQICHHHLQRLPQPCHQQRHPLLRGQLRCACTRINIISFAFLFFCLRRPRLGSSIVAEVIKKGTYRSPHSLPRYRQSDESSSDPVVRAVSIACGAHISFSVTKHSSPPLFLPRK